MEWVITMRRSQGQTIAKAVTYLVKSEATAGLISVCLNRAKQFVGLLVEPMPFDRLYRLSDKPTLKIAVE